MTSLIDVLRDVTDRLDSRGIEYFLVGSMATMYYGRPRYTLDLDLVVRLNARQVSHFEALFPIEKYYCPPNEVLQDEVGRMGCFNLIHHETGIKVDIVLDKETDFYTSEFSRKVKLEIMPGLKVNIASPEDLILKKLDYFREGESDKHLRDIREVIMNTKIDEAYIEEWVDRLNLRKEWEKI